MNPLFRLSSRKPGRLMLATLVLALVGGAVLSVDAAPGGLGPHGGGPDMAMNFGPGQVEQLLDSVNATAEQRALAKVMLDAAAAEQKAQREKARALHLQTLQIFTQPTVDARAAEGLRQQMLAQFDQASKRQMQTMLDVSRLLTPEQRKQFAERAQQRISMMERHRAERDSLDQPAR